MVEVSIIIPSWNRKRDLINCLNAIKKQTFKDYEVIIVDNNSTDGSKEEIRKRFPIFKIVALTKNVGAARARNIALNKTQGKFVWFLDSDAYPIKNGCLKTMIRIMEENNKIGQLGGEVVDGKIRIPNSCRNQDGLFEFLDTCKMLEVENIPTSNVIMRKSLIQTIGGFDPDYFYGYEDNNISFKIREKGYSCIVDEAVLAVHKRALNNRVSTFYLWHRNRVRFILLKETPLFILFLPIVDVYTTLKLLPEKIKILRTSKVVSKSKQSESILKTGFTFGTSMLKGYLWAFFNFPRIMYIRIKKPNFLENEN
jgi:GT2 family glycosyltransferase